MGPLNKGPLMGPRFPPAGARPIPPPRFAGRITPHGMPPRMPPLPPLNPPIFGPGGVSRPNGMLPRFPAGPRSRGMAPIVPPMGPRGSGPPRGPLLRPWMARVAPGLFRRMPLPPTPLQMVPPMRPRYNAGNGNAKAKTMGNAKKVKVEELELKKPWMTDEIRIEIQRKNKLYAKAKKNKDAVEWEEFKDLRNKVTRMIRDAKNEYLAKHPEQAHLYPDEEPYDQRDENYVSSGDDDDAPHYCEVCDRNYPSAADLSEHRSTHKLCGIDGCKFSAHPSLVEKHISMQHRTGLYHRLKDLSTPEDIETWIAERKKRYPTENNIKLRKAEELEKLQRGEIIKQNSNAHAKIKKPINTREKKRKLRKRRARETNNNYVHMNGTYRGLCPFPGLTVLEEEDGVVCSADQTDLHEKIIDNISDEDDIPQASTAPESANLPMISLPVLPTLVADYESEDDDEGPEEVPVKKIKMEYQDDKITENTIYEENSTQVYKETSNMQSYTNEVDKSNNEFQNTVVKCQDKQNRETNRISINNKNEKILHKYHNKLLEKLLSRSIQHERNLICQCVKYIIENNFFD